MNSLKKLVSESIDLIYAENASPANFEIKTVDLTTTVFNYLQIFEKEQIKKIIKEVCKPKKEITSKIIELDPSFDLKSV